MLKSLLIANRGEIACRIIRSCKKLGIRSIAAYSEADADALHVRMADESIKIGGPVASDSYLRIKRLVSAAKKMNTDAVHPGYGFLSENPAFVQALNNEGIGFVGPSAEIIRDMGDKIQARKLAKEAGVPVVPGTEGEMSDSEAMVEAQRIGFPIMVKAADGGGGMGIRSVENQGQLLASMAQARTQAENSFGSSRVYLEKRIDGASHVEVQVLADKHGNAVHLFERDCSTQRRNQKVLEETPCGKLDDKTRQALLESAVNLTKSIGYQNAGTVEYLLAPNGSFYFLEMNTRLQVEHPITEMVTGLDIVELQLRIASGEELPFKQEDVKSKGAAIEVRIYPEDPETLLPTYGVVSDLIEPTGENVRVDGALYVGYEVLPYYESLMSKLIVWAEDRPRAIEEMRKAIAAYQIQGVVTNQPLLDRILIQPKFEQSRYDTHFLENFISETASAGSGKEIIAAIALAMAIAQDRDRASQPSKWKMHGRRQSMVGRLSGGMN